MRDNDRVASVVAFEVQPVNIAPRVAYLLLYHVNCVGKSICRSRRSTVAMENTITSRYSEVHTSALGLCKVSASQNRRQHAA